MSEDVVKYGASALSDTEIKTLIQSNIIPNGTPKEQVAVFARVCAEQNLSPFSKQIHLVPRGGKYTIQTAIDGFRAIAERTGVYAGNDDYKFNGDQSEYALINQGIKQPTTATATVYKIIGGLRCPFSATVRWEEYYPGKQLGFMWDKMPFLMLGKCAESLVLRKAFPEALSGLYTNEEMAQVTEVPVIEIKNNSPELEEMMLRVKEFSNKVELKEKAESFLKEAQEKLDGKEVEVFKGLFNNHYRGLK
jgi:phage recombination protein Bet